MTSKVVDESDDGDASPLDADVVRLCQVGNRDAQRRLYETCHSQVFQLMVRMVGRQDAADLTQQVFLHLFRKIEQFEGRSTFETWLYRLAANEALQHLRKLNRRKSETLTIEPMSDANAESEPIEQRELLEQALAKVEPDLRLIFVLREMDGLSYREIAEAADVPEGTVGSRLNRVRRELQKHLADLGWEPGR